MRVEGVNSVFSTIKFSFLKKCNTHLSFISTTLGKFLPCVCCTCANERMKELDCTTYIYVYKKNTIAFHSNQRLELIVLYMKVILFNFYKEDSMVEAKRPTIDTIV
jgi:hypothetical protein